MRIYFTVGTYPWPAQRLVEAAAVVALRHEVRAQWGNASPPQGLVGAAWYPWQEHRRHMMEADAVVATGGMTPTEALDLGKVPVLAPRETAHQEHVDDHQVAFARHLEARGAALVSAPQPEALETAAAKAAAMTPPPRPAGGLLAALAVWLAE